MIEVRCEGAYLLRHFEPAASEGCIDLIKSAYDRRQTDGRQLAHLCYSGQGLRHRRRRGGWSQCGRGVPLPTGGWVWGRGCAPSPERFSFLSLNSCAFGARLDTSAFNGKRN